MRHSPFTYCCESQLKRPDRNVSHSSSNAGESVRKLSGFAGGGGGPFLDSYLVQSLYFCAHFDTLAKHLVATFCNQH